MWTEVVDMGLCTWHTDEDAVLEFLRQVDSLVWGALLKRNAGERIADLDHVDCCFVGVV